MEDGNENSKRFDEYIEKLCDVIGHKDRHEQLQFYCSGLLLPGDRKSVEPMAARLDPTNTGVRHQEMHHFVAKSPWKDRPVLKAVREYSLPVMRSCGTKEVWMVDDTGIPKKGEHSVGVARQYCGQLGKTSNCQVAVVVSLANEWTSLPLAFELYLPEAWAEDKIRRRKAGVPDDVVFMRKWEIALSQIDQLLEEKVPLRPLVADAGYGDTVEFRDELTTRCIRYILGISKNTTVWRQGEEPVAPPPHTGRGRKGKRLRRSHKPISVLQLAQEIPREDWQTMTWREGANGEMTSRFAAVRAHPAHRDEKRTELRPKEWILIEWPEGEREPTKYFISTFPEDTSIKDLVIYAKMRWRIERDFQELKDEIGLDHYEGRNWRGFHHHATLCIAAYGFLMAERARLSPPHARTVSPVKVAPLPEGFRPRGSPGKNPAAPTRINSHNESADHA